MAVGDVLLSLFGIFIVQLSVVLCYKSISSLPLNRKKFINFIIMVLFTMAFYAISMFYYGAFKIAINFILYLIQNKFIFKENNKKTLIKTFLIYSIMFLIDTLLIFLLIATGYESIQHFDKYPLAKNIYSLLVMLILCFIFIYKPLNNKIKFFVTKHANKMFNFIISIIILIYALISYRSILNFNSNDFVINISILVCFIILFIILLIQNTKTKIAEEKQEVLLEFLTKYEKIIDKDRINRHEMLNNLLLIKSQKNKNSKKFDELLNDIINTYKNPETDLTKNIYNLPTGLKGILYYKIHEMKNLDINVNLLISDKIITKINELDNESYKVIFKIVGILLDNAREGSILSEDKRVFIEFYLEKDSIIIYVENTIKTNIDLKNISKKGFSTKGKNRGMGLYIVEKLLEKNQSISLVQETNKNLFVSKLKIMTK